VRCALAGDGLRDLVAQRTEVDVAQQVFPGTQEHRPDGEVKLVDQFLLQVR
jgi:hypothetical protein